jgi:hypothetical protein
LGKFLQIGRLFTLGIFLKTIEAGQILGPLFSLEVMFLILTKMCWATSWAIFSPKTHLVTLVDTSV